MSQIVLQEVNREEWKSDLDQYNYSLFISPEWIEAVTDKHHKPLFIDFTINNKTVGKISGLVISKGGTSGTQLYFYSGPTLSTTNQSIYNSCFDAIFKYSKVNSISRIIIASYDNKHSLKYTKRKYFLTKRIEYVVPLHNGFENIMMSKRFRRNVKKGGKNNPEINQSKESNMIEILLKLLSATKMTRINKYHKDYNPYYLLNLNEHTLKKLLSSGIARFRYTIKNNSIASMEFNLEKDTSVYMLLKGTNENGYKNGLSSFLSFSLIKKYTEQNFLTYNLGGRISGKGGDGLETYKKSMGAEEMIVYGATTNYLTYPYKLLNPALRIGRMLPKNNAVVLFLKKFV